MAGLYIHIPFCASRCIYCGFYSTVRPNLQDRYIDCLCREMDLRARKSQDGKGFPAQNDAISTVYLGGGTPSQLSAENLQRLFLYINKVYHVDANAEVTMECNPDDICQPNPALSPVLGHPVNRVSMGAQTFSDERLKMLHRRHQAHEVADAVSFLREAGIGNISIDLMFGFPKESLDDWRKDIDAALALDVEHISAYSLMYEEGTPLFSMLQQGKVEEIDDELSLGMYDELTDRLAAAGYEHYEISNFCKPGFRSRHNSSYWHETPYIGLGAAAHSYDLKSRSWNVADITQYMEAIEKGILPIESETLDADTRYDDLVTTALRTCEGIPLARLDDGHRRYLLENAQKYIAQDLLTVKGDCLRLTRKGIYVSNMIMSDLMDV